MSFCFHKSLYKETKTPMLTLVDKVQDRIGGMQLKKTV